jgi:hypothetical protein
MTTTGTQSADVATSASLSALQESSSNHSTIRVGPIVGGVIGGLIAFILIGIGACKSMKWWNQESPKNISEPMPVNWEAAIKPWPKRPSSVPQAESMV